MPNYYDHEDYVSEKDMRGWNKDDKAEQRSVNWDIRLEYYAAHLKTAQFVKMLEKWYTDRDGRVPTLTMLKYGRLAKEVEERLTENWRPNQSQAEIENTRRIFVSHIVSRIVDETNAIEERLAVIRQNKFNELAERMVKREITCDQACAAFKKYETSVLPTEHLG
jgi:hypothetical protein